MNYTPSIPSSDCTSPLHTPPEPTVYNAANTGTPRNGQPDTAGATSEVIHFTPSQLATMWPRPALPDSFDARVERAWRFMRTMFFTPEEHAALVEAMVQMITQKQGPKQFSTTRSSCPKGGLDDTFARK